MIRALPKDPDLRAALPALRRAARAARRLAILTGTPCYIMRDGKIVNIAIKKRTQKRQRPRAKKLPSRQSAKK